MSHDNKYLDIMINVIIRVGVIFNSISIILHNNLHYCEIKADIFLLSSYNQQF